MPDRTHLLHTDAVVLRSMEYGETSRIVTFFTRERGKIAVMAKGARAGKSRFGSTLDPLSYVHVVLHMKSTRELQILSEASHVRTFDQIRSSLQNIESGIRIVELTSALLQSDQEHPSVFGLLVASLSALDGSPGRTANVWPFFQLRLATILGFEPSFESDVVKSLVADQGVLDLDTGEILADGPGFRASRQALRAFSVLARADLSDVMRMQMDPELTREVERMVSAYLKVHVDDSYPDRSEKVFAQFDERRR